MDKHLDTTPEKGRRFYMDFQGKDKIVMLNLLKYKEVADYSNFDSIKPNRQVSGKVAYQTYMECTLPILNKAGGKLIYLGKCGDFLIGPDHEKWDAVLMVEHESVEKFISFAEDEEYLKILGHRTAALEDSRLLPTTEIGS